MQAGEAQDPDSGLVSIPTSFLKDHGSASEAFSAEQQNGNWPLIPGLKRSCVTMIMLIAHTIEETTSNSHFISKDI